MSNPNNLRYSKSHEWVRIEGDLATCGITEYAQEALGDVVYVDLPEVGDTFDRDGELGEIESVKAVSAIYSPITGEVIEVNEELDEAPEKVNADPYGDGWLFQLKVSSADEVDQLMDADAYEAFLETID
ncbi:MAG: glycine cleavage system protein GcvH [Myxococcota bacterium]|nr:glycine cleavage system protein GcvH [Myxococcota bacterium]MEC8423801.1 glycine cleavage system protein GcvH [Myxococcota bacterium]